MTQDMALEKTMKINFKKSTDFIYSLNKIKQDEFILYHHLGLEILLFAMEWLTIFQINLKKFIFL